MVQNTKLISRPKPKRKLAITPCVTTTTRTVLTGLSCRRRSIVVDLSHAYCVPTPTKTTIHHGDALMAPPAMAQMPQTIASSQIMSVTYPGCVPASTCAPATWIDERPRPCRRQRTGSTVSNFAPFPALTGMDQPNTSPTWILSVAARSACPRCGKGKLFDGFLTLARQCDVCGLDYSFADPADGPAFFSMMFMAV